MSVFGFSKTDKVWGLKRSYTMLFIERWIDMAGPRPYLLRIQESYELGFNHGDMRIVSISDKAHFRDLVAATLESDIFDVFPIEQRLAVRDKIVDLRHLLNSDLEGTPLHRQF